MGSSVIKRHNYDEDEMKHSTAQESHICGAYVTDQYQASRTYFKGDRVKQRKPKPLDDGIQFSRNQIINSPMVAKSQLQLEQYKMKYRQLNGEEHYFLSKSKLDLSDLTQ